MYNLNNEGIKILGWKYNYFMQIERNNDELVLRITETIDPKIVQKFIDYVRLKGIVSKSRAKEKDIENISNEINTKWWKENKERFIK